MLAHLHTSAPAPTQYIKYVLYKEFGWRPKDVKEIPLPDLLDILTCMRAEVAYQNRPRSKKPTKPA